MHVCFFDIDGTLVRTGGAGRSAMEAALASEFGALDPPGDVPFSGRTDRAIISDLLRGIDMPPTAANLGRCLHAYLRHLPDQLASRRGEVLPGIGNLLDRLGGLPAVALGLLTGNVRDGARIKLSHYGLFGHFDFGGFGDLHENRNDVARAALDEARQTLNTPLDVGRVWVVGDSPHDVRCARSIGARAVAVATGWNTLEELEAEQPDVLLADLSDESRFLALLD